MNQHLGEKISKSELIDFFSAGEGAINMYYGLIGNGKTYAATADILDALRQGRVVYANWHINVSDFDDRDSFLVGLRNVIFLHSRYFMIPCAQNLHYFSADVEPDDEDSRCQCGVIHAFEGTVELVTWLSSLNDCDIFFDEGQDMFDSYEGTKFSKLKRRLILHTRHYHRTLNIISQRPTAIQVSARGNVNRFYKCVKIGTWPVPRFARLEYQEMSGETVDETVDPVSIKRYWGRRRVFSAYNTDYLADGIERSQEVFFEAYRLKFTHRIVALSRVFGVFVARVWHFVFRRRGQKKTAPAGNSVGLAP